MHIDSPFKKHHEYPAESAHIQSHNGPVIGKKVIVPKPGDASVLELHDFEFPFPGTHEVRVRVEAIGLNYIDTYCRSGLYPLPYPSGLGTEGAGIVEAVGPEVTEFAVGDRVGYCTGPSGAYADYYLVSESKLIKLPHHISFEVAAASLLKGLTAQYLIKQLKHLYPDDIVVFWAAAGGVGLIALQWLKSLSVKVIAITSGGAKAEAAHKAGAWKVIDHKTEDVVAKVLEYTDGQKARIVYDSVGKASWERSLDMTQPRGLLVSYGNASGPVTDVNLGVLAQKGSLFVTRPTLAGYADNHRSLREMASEMFTLVNRDLIKIDINHRYPLSGSSKAQEELEQGNTMGSTVIYPDAIAEKFYNL